MKRKISLTINGKAYDHEVEPRLLLIHYLREVAGLTGPHIGCETSICGACTVMLDGRTVKSCTMFAVQADGRNVITIEGLAADGKLDPVQEAFWNEHGLQCGFCTPGMLIMARDILRRHSRPDVATVRHELSAQICRCTGYANIVKAIVAAGQEIAEVATSEE